MKALLVADNKLVIDNISQILETAGYDVIIYNWLLKALDNVEEISPHLIVVSAKDYPRHWKTLAQYASMGFRSYKPQIILYAEGGLSEDDMQKAKTLNIRGVFESVDVKGLDQLRKILTKESDIFSGNLTEEEIPTIDNLLSSNEKNNLEEAAQENLEFSQSDDTEETFLNTATNENTELQAESQEERQAIQADCSAETSETTSDLSAETQKSQDTFTAESTENTSELSAENNSEPSTEQEQTIAETTENSLEVATVPLSTEVEVQITQNAAENTLETAESSTDGQDSSQKNLVCSFMFTNPLSGELVTGYAFNFDGKTFIFKADIPEFVSNLSTGTQISCASLKLSEEIKTVRSLVRENAAEMLLELV